jgi:D-alanyl-D-alanine carboxypeptidase (penicillin-binding protein 5/6)
MVWGSKPVRHYTLAVNYDHQKQNKRGKLLAPIRKNERVGEIELSSPGIRTINGEPLTYDLYSEEQVPRGNFWQRLWH